MGHACTLCHVGENPDQKIVFGGDIVLFLHNEKEQGALLGSGVIIPLRHAEAVFDLTPGDVKCVDLTPTFARSSETFTDACSPVLTGAPNLTPWPVHFTYVSRVL